MSSILKGLMTEKNIARLGTVREDAQRADELQFAYQQAKNITKEIRYDGTVNQILTNIELLVEKYNIDKNSFQVAETEVKNAQRELEAAIYNLDKIFEDAMKEARWGQEDVDEGQIYSTGGGPGEGRHKYRVKPAGI